MSAASAILVTVAGAECGIQSFANGLIYPPPVKVSRLKTFAIALGNRLVVQTFV
ncbi:MAG TPA: hypothetical protein V6D25_20505 [Leptolyngbyaceae cyanobacterium]